MVYNLTIISLFYPYKQKTYTNDIYNIVYIYIPYAPWYIYLHHWVTGWWSTYPSEKYESMGRIIPYMKWKITKIFETTNQFLCLCWLTLTYVYSTVDEVLPLDAPSKRSSHPMGMETTISWTNELIGYDASLRGCFSAKKTGLLKQATHTIHTFRQLELWPFRSASVV